MINASEERTAKLLLQRIESITNTQNITLDKEVKKPSLLILDEVDGTLEKENNGAINSLLKYIFTGEKKKPKKEDENKNAIQIKRPVIFICNDIYGKGMKELRKRSIVFHFKNSLNQKLIQRLQVIFSFLYKF